MADVIEDIKIGVNLIDDYLLTQDAPVANGLTRDLFSIVQNPLNAGGASELLTLDGTGKPVHFYPDTSSQSGWSTTSIPVTPPGSTKGTCSRILGFYHQGVLNALFYFPLDSEAGSAAVWMQSAQAGTWAEAELDGDAANFLGYTYQTDQYVDSDGNAYLYGITGNISPANFFVITYVTETVNGVAQSFWRPIFGLAADKLNPPINDPETAAFRLTEGKNGAGSATVLWVAGNKISHQEATITWTKTSEGRSANFQLVGNMAETFDPNVGTLQANNLYAVPGDLGSGNLFILDSTSKLWWISDFYAASPSLTPMTGDGSTQPKSATAFGIGVDDTKTVTAFAIEADTNYLWYVQQIQQDSLVFGSWVSLGGDLHTLNCPAYMPNRPELFSAGIDNDTSIAVYRTSQNQPDEDEDTYIWSTHKVSAPPSTAQQAPTRTATYSMELQGFDAGGNPVGNGNVTVTADQNVTVVWNGYSYHIGPNTPLGIQLDTTGQTTVLFECVDLKPAVVTFTAYDEKNAVSTSRWVRGDVVQYIKALDGAQLQILPTSVAPQLKNATGSELISNGLTGGSYNSSGPANTAAQAINACGNYMFSTEDSATDQGAVNLENIAVPHWQIDFTDPEHPKFRALSDAEAEAFLASLPQSGDATAQGSLGGVFGDVAHFFKHEFDQLEKFTATVTQEGLKIVFNDITPFIVSTVKQVGAGLETIFAKIRNIADEIYSVIKDVIDWLKSLFEWDDILNTHTAIKQVIECTLGNMKTGLAAAETDLSKWFSKVDNDINDAFQDIEKQVGSNTSYNGYVNGMQTAMPGMLGSNGNALAGTSVKNSQQQHSSKCNYVYSRSKTSFGNISQSMQMAAPKTDEDSTQSIINAIQQYILDPQNSQGDSIYTVASQQFESFITDTLKNPANFFDLLIQALLEAIDDLANFAVGALEKVVKQVLQLLADAISALNGMITQKIEIPIISWLWENVISKGNTLTILDLICLIIAVPTTIIYKILFGGSNAAPPFSSATLNELTPEALAWPTLPNAAADGRTWGDPVDGYTPPSPAVLKALGILAGLSYYPAAISAVAADDIIANGDPDDIGRGFSILGILMALYQTGALAPYDVFAKSQGDRSIADNWALDTWYAGLFPTGCDICFVAVSESHRLTEFVQKYGPVADTVFGACELTMGIFACVNQSKPDSGYTSWDCSVDIIAPLSETIRCLLLNKATAELVQDCDIVLYLGTMVVVCGAAANG